MASIEDLKKLGFESAPKEVPKRLIASTAGFDKTGKSRLAATAPDPVLLFNFDLGTEGVLEPFVKQGKNILKYDIRMPEVTTNSTKNKQANSDLWDSFKERFERSLTLGEGTIVVDTATEAWELLRLAYFGKTTQVLPTNYTEINNIWRELIRKAYDSKCSVIFIHKLKAKWLNGQRTDEFELAGMGEMDYLVQINLRTRINPEGQFELFIKNCRQNASLSGSVLTGPMIDFKTLLNMVHGS